MYNQLVNSKGEDLFILVINYTNDIEPYIRVSTWEDNFSYAEHITQDIDNERMLCQVVNKEVDTKNRTFKAITRRNRKGWGNDYFKYITIKPLCLGNV